MPLSLEATDADATVVQGPGATAPRTDDMRGGLLRLHFERGHKARSLTWVDGSLVDIAGGHAVVRLDGSTGPAKRDWGFDFDRALVAPSGLRVLYGALGTKGLVASANSPVREIDRSYYRANAFEYPVAVGELPGGAEVLAHCPGGYYRISVETLARGQRLCGASSSALDVFHSRLAFDRGGSYLLSAGWTGNATGVAMVFDIPEALGDSSHLDGPGLLPRSAIDGSVEGACWLGPGLLAVSTGPGPRHSDGGALPPRHLGLWSAEEGTWVSQARLRARTGTMHALGERLLCLFSHPRLVDPVSARDLQEWPDLDSGSQDSSVIWQLKDAPPPFAADPKSCRFAIAHGDVVTVVEVDQD